MRADVVLFDLEPPQLGGGDDAARLVFAAQDADVRTVLVGGVVRVDGGRVLDADPSALRRRADAALARLRQRAGWSR
jgi:cytosine/adenosine deaminase-related metal-dependent hydrolase